MKEKRPTIGKSLIFAIIVTLAITSLLVFLSPQTARAVTVSIAKSTTSVIQGSSITFTATVQIQSNERIPIQSAKLRLFSNASGSVEKSTSPYSSPRTMALTASNPSGGNYGYGYGYGSDSGTPYSFGYGYGYGGYSGVVTLTYQCTLSTSTAWAVGTYYARADIDCGSHTFSSTITSFTITAAGGSGGGAPGGGGGGGTPPPTTTIPPATTTPGPGPQPTFTPGPPPSPTQPSEKVIEDLTGKISPDGVMTEGVVLTSTDGNAKVEIPAGTVALDASGNALSEITVQPPDTSAPVPPGVDMIVVADFGPDGATFDPPISITMTYDPDALPPGVAAEDLVLAYYNASTGEWVTLSDIVVDTANHTVSGTTSHFTQFAILTKAAVPVTSPTPIQPVPTTVEGGGGGGINPWVIIGPIIGVVVVALLAFLEMERRKGITLF